MDNCRSFHYLAPYLVQQNQNAAAHVVALEFPGHGWSDHRPVTGPGVVLAELTYYVAEAIHELKWQKSTPDDDIDDGSNNNNTTASGFNGITLIGHSMGAAVACLYAAAFPEHVQRLILLEGLGPLTRPTRDVAKHVRAHVERRLHSNIATPSSSPRIYPSLDVAIKTRCQTARNFPGKQWLSEEAAREMVIRGTIPAKVNGIPNDNDNNNAHQTSGGAAAAGASAAAVQFRHDPRLLWPSIQYYTPEQNEALYQDITCSTIALIHAQDGWPLEKSQKQHFLELLSKNKPSSVDIIVECLPGSHHFHADPDTALAVAQAVVRALQGPRIASSS
jgi:pimeloyl-ACP methyl ester carboxylesterase